MSVLYPVLLSEIVITSANNTVRYTEVPGPDHVDVTIPVGSYFLSGSGEDDDLLGTLADLINVAEPDADVVPFLAFRVESTPCVVGMAGAGATLDAAETTLDLGVFGDFDTIPGASTLTPDNVWVGNEPEVRSDASFEGITRQTRMTSGTVRTFERAGPFELRELELQLITAERTFLASTSADPNRAFESFWRRVRDGRRLQLHAAAVAEGTTLATLSAASTLVGEYVVDEETARRLAPRRFDPGLERYGWTLGLRGYL